jgi:hypothetical protein
MKQKREKQNIRWIEKRETKKRTKQIRDKTTKNEGKENIVSFPIKVKPLTTRATVFSFLFILTQMTDGGEETRHGSTGRPQSTSIQRHHVFHYNDI